jgi:hypothetical protein
MICSRERLIGTWPLAPGPASESLGGRNPRGFGTDYGDFATGRVPGREATPGQGSVGQGGDWLRRGACARDEVPGVGMGSAFDAVERLLGKLGAQRAGRRIRWVPTAGRDEELLIDFMARRLRVRWRTTEALGEDVCG